MGCGKTSASAGEDTSGALGMRHHSGIEQSVSACCTNQRRRDCPTQAFPGPTGPVCHQTVPCNPNLFGSIGLVQTSARQSEPSQMSGSGQASDSAASARADAVDCAGADAISPQPTSKRPEAAGASGFERLVSRIRRSFARRRPRADRAGRETTSPGREETRSSAVGCFSSLGGKIKATKASQQQACVVDKAPKKKPRKNRKVPGTVLVGEDAFALILTPSSSPPACDPRQRV
ncbi:unnamed protein product [Protopolystoma xenopodis]|uniref:Uncharacterized protein n=1 Tax=Protopolystoma xenopodis TaxID=117903 RepID=A0A448WD22_9PLAT|nr:unnamed protein product [Protopolystoma xenopodis]